MEGFEGEKDRRNVIIISKNFKKTKNYIARVITIADFNVYYSVREKTWYWNKNDTLISGIECTHISPHPYSHHIFDKEANNGHW